MKMIVRASPHLLVLILFLTISYSLHSQVFSGFSAFKEMIEYEGQRYLMEDVYQIATENFDRLKIDKTIKEVDDDEGFMFVLTSYVFNEKKGVVITSFNSTNFQNSRYQFTNVHLTDKEFNELYNVFLELEKQKPKYWEHYLRRYNSRLIVDVTVSGPESSFILWVDNYSRHTFSTNKWDRSYKRYRKFVE